MITVPELADHIQYAPDGDTSERQTDAWRAALVDDPLIITNTTTPDATVVNTPDEPLETAEEIAPPAEDTDPPPPDGETPTEQPAPVDETRYLGSDLDDRVTLTPALTLVDGGAGTDTLIVEADFAEARIIFGAAHEVLLDPGPEAPALTLQNVERIAFSDGTLAFDDDGLAGQAYRLYQACFDRVPDAEGLGFWIKQLDAGNVTLTDAANFFLTSREFANVYGEPDALADVHYLALLYANVLNRVPDQDGFAFWRDQQDKGITRADMLVHFSESAENKALVAEAIDDGIWYF